VPRSKNAVKLPLADGQAVVPASTVISAQNVLSDTPFDVVVATLQKYVTPDQGAPVKPWASYGALEGPAADTAVRAVGLFSATAAKVTGVLIKCRQAMLTEPCRYITN